jgi:alkanesulfonate monooxygenase SsuD/methylene tetrahydromethanopterin reductase-like flavin-dependent oxidoreductase (luciferase family)
MIKPWVFEFFPELGSAEHDPDPQDVAAYFARYLDLWVKDEALGFEGIFFSEHHFGGSFSASPNLLIASVAARTKRLRLGVMGVVLPYYHPARVVEEMGLLDHLTGGRLELGTAVGVPQELARLNLTMEEARERSNEITDAIDAALNGRVISLAGKHFAFSNLRPLPRTLQRPSPPRWTAVVSVDSARRAARRGLKISTGFNSTETVKAIFDAYREEASDAGLVVGPDHLALRRRVTVAATSHEARSHAAAVAERLKSFVAQDPRVQQSVPDSPTRGGGGFTVSDDEFISGTPTQVAAEIIAQCRAVGAGHFLTVLNWGAPVDEVEQAHDLFGREANPLLRAAAV